MPANSPSQPSGHTPTNATKNSFDHIYNLADPRGYYGTLRELDYSTPAHASNIFARCVEALRDLRGRDTVTVLDLCCGYGVNAALLNHSLDLDSLYQHYTAEDVARLGVADMAALDREYYSRSAEPQAVVIGVDVAANALHYAEQVDLLERGFSTNLERQDPDDELSEALAGVDLVTVTGGLSYIGERTFSRVLECAEEAPWVASFPLRGSDFTPVVETLDAFGLTDELWNAATFPHRRFADAAEMQRVVSHVQEQGIDVDGKEAEGYYHAELHLTRPAVEMEIVPIDYLLR